MTDEKTDNQIRDVPKQPSRFWQAHRGLTPTTKRMIVLGLIGIGIYALYLKQIPIVTSIGSGLLLLLQQEVGRSAERDKNGVKKP